MSSPDSDVSPEPSPELDHPLAPPALAAPAPLAPAPIPAPEDALARFLEQEEDRKRRRDLQDAAVDAAAASSSSSATTRSASPRRRAARQHAMDLKWEAVRTDWALEFPEYPLPIVRPTSDNATFGARPAPPSNPSQRDLSSVLSSRRGVPVPRSGTPSSTGGAVPRVRTPPMHFGHPHTPHLPPSPLGKISDDQASYFSGVAETLDGTSPSEGMVIQSPDGRPAIFFQPQRAHRTSSSSAAARNAVSRPMERDRDSPDPTVGAAAGPPVSHPHRPAAPGAGPPPLPTPAASLFTQSPIAGPGEGPPTPPAVVTNARVAAPHEIGLGQSRRLSSNSSSNSGDPATAGGGSSPLLAGTPALSLDSFIAKSRGQSEDSLPGAPDDAASLASLTSSAANPRRSSAPSATGPSAALPANSSGSNNPAGLLSRQQSTSSLPSRPSSTRPTSSSPRGPSGTRSVPTPSSMAVDDLASPNATPIPSPLPPPAVPPSGGRHRDASNPGSPHPGHTRRSSGSTSAGTSRRQKARRGTIPAVPPINVLIVEDNPINQRILSHFMKGKGIKYDVAKDGEEAVQKWRDGSFHLVLMDIQLPVKDGIEATREIRDIERASNVGTLITTPNSDPVSPFSPLSSASSHVASPTSPPLSMPVIIVALTASSLQVDRVTALAAGCNDFLTKPVSLPWLQQKLLEWGSMAYLSGFSRNQKDSTQPVLRSSPAFSASFNTKAAAISDHLHIDRRVPPGSASPHRSTFDRSSAATATSASASATSTSANGLSVTVSSPTPVLTPQPLVLPTSQGSSLPEDGDGAGPELMAVDTRLHDLQTGGAARRPGPSPLSPPSAGEPSLESIMSEGARLAETARSRTRANSSARDSFSLVMHDSGTVHALPQNARDEFPTN